MAVRIETIAFTADNIAENASYLLGELEQMPGALARRYQGYSVYIPRASARRLSVTDEEMFVFVYYLELRSKAKLLNAHGLEVAVNTYAPDVMADACHAHHRAFLELLTAKSPYVRLDEPPKFQPFRHRGW